MIGMPDDNFLIRKSQFSIKLFSSVLWVQVLVLHLVFGGFGGATATGRALIIFISGSFVGRTEGQVDRWSGSSAFNGQ